MLLSIIIPVYNVEQYIERCICSCLDQDISYSDYELVVVNDGTPDDSIAIVEKIQKECSNIIIINRNNGGLSAARNTGLDNASGDYIMFLDSDDWLAKNSLSKIKKCLIEERPDVLMICAADEIDGVLIRRQQYKKSVVTTGIEVLKERIPPCAPFSIVKKELIDKNNLRFFEGIYHEDSEYTPRLFYYAKRVLQLNDIIYCVYQNPNSITRTNNPQKAYDIVEKVCPSLHHFSVNKEKEFQSVINNRISMDINTALSNFDISKEEHVHELNRLFVKNQYLFKHLRRASFLKYRIEGLLFTLFPNKVVQIYDLLIRIKF